MNHQFRDDDKLVFKRRGGVGGKYTTPLLFFVFSLENFFFPIFVHR